MKFLLLLVGVVLSLKDKLPGGGGKELKEPSKDPTKPGCGSVYGSCDKVPNAKDGDMKYCCNVPDTGCPEGFKQIKDRKYTKLCMPDGSGQGGDKRCGVNEFYNDCGSPCEKNCQNKDVEGLMCMSVCKPGCYCDMPYIRGNDGKKCVMPKECGGPKPECAETNVCGDKCCKDQDSCAVLESNPPQYKCYPPEKPECAETNVCGDKCCKDQESCAVLESFPVQYKCLPGKPSGNKGCCYNMGFGAMMVPCCQSAHKNQPANGMLGEEKCPTDDKKMGGITMFEKDVTCEQHEANNWGEKLISGEKGCCYNMGFGAMMVPCCQSAHKKQPANGMLGAEECPTDDKRSGGSTMFEADVTCEQHEANNWGEKKPTEPKTLCNKLKKKFKGKGKKEKLEAECSEREDCEFDGKRCKKIKVKKVKCNKIEDPEVCKKAGCDGRTTKKKGFKCKNAKKPKGPQKCKFDKKKFADMKGGREEDEKKGMMRTGMPPLSWGLSDETCKCEKGKYGYCGENGECSCQYPTLGRPYSEGKTHLSSEACKNGAW